MRTLYVTPAPANQLTAHNIKVSSFVTIGKTLLHHNHNHNDGTSLFLYPLLVVYGSRAGKEWKKDFQSCFDLAIL
jgi:hypothetical protein